MGTSRAPQSLVALSKVILLAACSSAIILGCAADDDTDAPAASVPGAPTANAKPPASEEEPETPETPETPDMPGPTTPTPPPMPAAGPFHAHNALPSSCADPGSITVNGTIYVACTGPAKMGAGYFPIWSSKDASNWKYEGPAVPTAQIPNWSGGDYWAPSFLQLADGTFALYFTALQTKTNLRAVGVASSKSVTGPFVDKIKKPLVATNSATIDPQGFSHGGRNYLYWKINSGGAPESEDALWGQEMNAAGSALVGNPKKLFARKEVGYAKSGDLEAPWATTLPGSSSIFLFFSTGKFCDQTYAVGVARADSPLGDFQKDIHPGAILSGGKKWRGPGHNAMTTTPDGKPAMVYHAFQGDSFCEGGGSGRKLMLDAVRVNAQAGRWSTPTWTEIAPRGAHPPTAPSLLDKDIPMLRRPSLALVAALLISAFAPGCGAEGDTANDGSSEDEVRATDLSARRIAGAPGFKTFSTEGGGFGQSGRILKFLIDNRNASKQDTYFINGNYKVRGEVPEYAQYHFDFARQKLGIAETNESFNQTTYFEAKKRFYAGTVQTYFIDDSKEPTYAVQFYPDDVISEDSLLLALTAVRGAFAIPNAKLAFVATGPQQKSTRVAAKIAALGFEVTSIERMLGNVKYFPMNAGEAWGYLRLFPRDLGSLRPTDIPIFDELPLDLSVVAGTITRVYQDATSHVNLKSKERGTPNMVLRDVSANHPALRGFIDKPVHIKVNKEGFVIEATSDAVVQAKLKARLDRPWIALDSVAETRLMSYDEMCPQNAATCLGLVSRYGGKATGLGFLVNESALGRLAQPGSMSRKMGYELGPKGFAIPVQGYRDFVADPANTALKSKIEALITREKSGVLSPNDRLQAVKDVQAMFLAGHLDEAKKSAVLARIGQTMPGVSKLKVRSSSNAEDVPNFDGAGLYDSFAAKPAETDNPDHSCELVPDDDEPTKSKVKPKTVECAIKAVYASLWNVRALEERSFARLDHASSGMGLALVPSYDEEDDVAANAVVVTRVVNSVGILGYSLSVQKGENLVTNPLPGTIAETDVVTFSDYNRPPHFSVARYSTPEAGKPALTAPILTTKAMTDLIEVAKRVEVAYCRARGTSYYDGNCDAVWLDDRKPSALDMEVKILANGHFIFKQSREFHGR